MSIVSSLALKASVAASALHTTATISSISAALLRQNPRRSPKLEQAVTPPLEIRPERLAKLERTIGLMYSAEPFDMSMFAETCTFEDPAAICRGYSEIEEAFRALRALEPLPIEQRAIKVKGDVVSFDSLVQYKIGGYTTKLPSTIIVQDDGHGKICSITELWNHNSLIPLLQISRRLNGIVSYQVTKRLIR